MSAADPGTVLLVIGAALVGASVLATAVAGWPADGGVRRLGRVLLAVVGPLTRPLRWPFRAYYRYLTEPAEACCARLGHRGTWDGYRERCARCDARSYPGTRLPDPTARPSPSVDVDAATVRAWVAELDRRATRTRDALAADAARLRADAARHRDDARRSY